MSIKELYEIALKLGDTEELIKKWCEENIQSFTCQRIVSKEQSLLMNDALDFEKCILNELKHLLVEALPFKIVQIEDSVHRGDILLKAKLYCVAKKPTEEKNEAV